jgi:DNA-binding response OmpR family regulator
MIDDDPTAISRVGQYLDPQSYHFEATTDPMEGIRKIKENLPNIIVLDIKMPEMLGYEVCKRLHEHAVTRDIPIIIYSVFGDTVDTYINSLTVGAYAVLQKGDFTVLEKGDLGRLVATIERFARIDLNNHTRVKTFRMKGYELKVQGEAERVWLNGKERFMRRKTQKILAFLISKPGIFIDSKELINVAFSEEDEYGRATDDIHRLIHDLRLELEPHPHNPIFIESKRRSGYRLAVEEGNK